MKLYRAVMTISSPFILAHSCPGFPPDESIYSAMGYIPFYGIDSSSWMNNYSSKLNEEGKYCFFFPIDAFAFCRHCIFNKYKAQPSQISKIIEYDIPIDVVFEKGRIGVGDYGRYYRPELLLEKSVFGDNEIKASEISDEAFCDTLIDELNGISNTVLAGRLNKERLENYTINQRDKMFDEVKDRLVDCYNASEILKENVKLVKSDYLTSNSYYVFGDNCDVLKPGHRESVEEQGLDLNYGDEIYVKLENYVRAREFEDAKKLLIEYDKSR